MELPILGRWFCVSLGARTPRGPASSSYRLATNERAFYLFIYLFIYFYCPEAHGGSQARGRFGAVATGLHQSHSNAGSKPRLQPTF